MSKPATYIHLGLPKTATTTLQSHLFKNHSQIHYLGKFVGDGFSPAILSALISRTKKTTQFESGSIHLKPLHEQQAYAVKNGKPMLLSKEGLAGSANHIKRRQAQSFAEQLGPCKIILFLREPESFIKSFYTQMIKAFHKAKQQRADWMKNLGNPPLYFDINEWMNAAWNAKNTPRNFLAWADTADIYAEMFGRENISIYLFEDLIATPKKTISALCCDLGIDAEEGLRLMDQKRKNDRLTTDYTDRIKALEKSMIQSYIFRRAGPKKRNAMLYSNQTTEEKIRPILSDKWKKEIHAFSEQQNRRMTTQWNIPLADYGYKV